MRKLILALIVLVLLSIVLWYSGGNEHFDEVALAQNEIGIELDSQMLAVNGIQLHTVFAGPKNGEPVILIHGFPQFWYAWRWQIKALAEQGFRVVAVDMRGYNRSGKPRPKSAYDYEDYAADITALMDLNNWPTANIVSHDIGGIVSWELVFDHSRRIKRAIIFSAAHPMAYQHAIGKSEVSWYRSFFRIPILPELLSRLGGLELTAASVRDSSLPGTFDDAQLEVYKTAWRRDHAYYSMLGSYRNDGLDLEYLPKSGMPQMPVMYINGLKDKFVTPEVARASARYLRKGNVKLYPELSHWLLEEEPKKTSQDILEFLRQPIPQR